MIQVEWAEQLSVPVQTAFSYVTEPANWHAFFPGFVAFTGQAGPRWQVEGDRITLVARVLRVPTRLSMTLEERIAPARVRFVMQQVGSPAVAHERVFSELGDGACQVRFIARFEPRRGALALVDCLLFPRLLKRSFRAAAQAISTNVH